VLLVRCCFPKPGGQGLQIYSELRKPIAAVVPAAMKKSARGTQPKIR
jgi:hypothetical protein